MYVINKKLDFFLIQFPIFFPLVYGLSIYYFPLYENYIIILTIFLLAEPHFGATWPFMISKNNKNFILNKKIQFVVLPILIILCSVLSFFYFKKEFLLLFFLANVFHVTRQSAGISKLYIKDNNERRFHEYSIYIFNIILFFVGFFRFYLPLIGNSEILSLNLFLFLFFFLIIFLYILKYKFTKNVFTLITGLIIFTPIAFVQNPVHAIIMGVTMHYSQYLVLTYIVNYRRNKNYKEEQNNSLFKSKKKFIIIVFLYSIIMSVFSLSNKYSFFNINSLILIPIIFQFLHFYFDSLLWRFSVAENRTNTLNFIYSKS
jgi:hypothetical protein